MKINVLRIEISNNFLKQKLWLLFQKVINKIVMSSTTDHQSELTNIINLRTQIIGYHHTSHIICFSPCYVSKGFYFG
jgi:hypothetical protein